MVFSRRYNEERGFPGNRKYEIGFNETRASYGSPIGLPPKLHFMSTYQSNHGEYVSYTNDIFKVVKSKLPGPRDIL
jgi:hypothetical protein